LEKIFSASHLTGARTQLPPANQINYNEIATEDT